MTNKLLRIIYIILGLSSSLWAQPIKVDVNLNFNHKVDTISRFDRAKFVAIHADVAGSEWGTNFGPNSIQDIRDDFLNGYDVYLGRNTGPITFELRNTNQDPNRPGFADTTHMISRSINSKNRYISNPSWHSYEHRNDLILCAQLHPFWPDGQTLNTGWALSQEDSPQNPFGTATGEYMGHFIKHYFGNGGATGQPAPKWVEVINEPIWHLVDINQTNQPIEIFNFHKNVAREIKKLNPSTQVGGWCTAFPDFEKNNFQQWEDRWKLFMDSTGADMDFWTIHLYDFPTFGGKELYRKGSNMEATFDMMEQYSFMKFGEVKDIMVSEYGAQTHDYKGPWSPYRDWLKMKSVNSMMLQFMERPHVINKVLNFLIIKATWGTNGVNDTYTSRLMRRADEPNSLSGEWVYTEQVKTYMLWHGVKGKRVDSWANNPDVLTDAFVDGNKAYIILNNLNFEDQAIQLDIQELNNLPINNLMIKRMYLGDSQPIKDQNGPVLDTLTYTSNFPEEFILKPEATHILEYTFGSNVPTDKDAIETKYYSDTYYQSINAGVSNTFEVNNISKGPYGEATLRIGLGRAHGKSLRPTLKINDSLVYVPFNYRGDDQIQRDSYFGVLEVDVPYELLGQDNEFDIRFSDDGGFISSLSLQVYEFSEEITRTQTDTLTSIEIFPQDVAIQLNGGKQFEEYFFPTHTQPRMVEWISLDPTIAKVNESGWVSGEAFGTTQIVVRTPDGLYADTAVVRIENTPGGISVDDRNKYLTTAYRSGDVLEVIVNYEAGTGSTVTDGLGGVQVMLREVASNWSVVRDYVASDPSAIGQQSGQATVQIDLTGVTPSADLPSGNFYFLFPRFNTSSGESFAVNGLNPILILPGTTQQDEVYIDPSVKIYPNPSKNRVKIKGDQSFTTATFYSMSGQMIFSTSIKDGSIDIRRIPDGIYMVKLSNKTHEMMSKLVIQR